MRTRQPLLPLRVLYFFSFAALGVFGPFFPRWLLAQGVDGFAMGAILATLPAMGLIGPPLVGSVADMFGRHRAVLRMTTVGAFLAIVVLAVVAGTGVRITFLEIFAIILAHAAFRSPMVVMTDVVAIDQAPKAGVSYGRVRSWGSIGSLVGAVGLARVIDPSSAVALPLATAAPFALAALASFALPEAEPPRRLSLRGASRALATSPDILNFMATVFISEIALCSYDFGFVLRLGELGAPTPTIGAAWALGLASETALLTFAGRLVARFTPARLVVVALLVAAVRCALLGTLTSVPALVAIQPLHAASVALFWISCVSYVKGRAAPEAAASAQGLFAAVVAAGTAVGMLLWGTIYRAGGSRATFLGAAVAALVASGIAVAWTTRAHEIRQAA